MFRIVRCIRSAFPFKVWLFASLTCRRTPVAWQKSSTFLYSPPPSVRSTWTRQLYCFSKTRGSARTSLWLRPCSWPSTRASSCCCG
ncbi:hypothetical protein PF007_g12526 [Phytophthora fragariae]|uniref:Uncharacterized protein n=1 Tax=Phytophthora fragariae TaxID=53985 RepID=A0A6A3S4S9_9STRA|nr:hypothetical protein PF009_g14197 [Phytophthora fragariae]KAE9007333.1 hypothetical protein PF011_g11172 [Phytophthora fragariae]KAE9108774.1 hypothetical protein PF007_g12526 [Phytophthora fragariae]KAE9190154.1 hypothetical protein PF004_g21989 [Phytophthora fragariae]